MMRHKISVIVPIYKTGKILIKTLNSIKNQSFGDFECVIVDDGSNDNDTFLICKKFVLEDSRFIYCNKINEGIEKTRIFGVKKSRYDLLVFCDHDDYYEKHALQLLYDAWLSSKADIVVANCYSQMFAQIPIKNKQLGFSSEFVLDRKGFMEKYYENFFGINVFPVSTWGKLYSKHLFAEDLASFGYNFLEDIVLNAQLFSRILKVQFIPPYIYTHIYGGLSSKFDVRNVFTGYINIYHFRNKLLLNNMLFEKLNKFLLIEYKNVLNQYVMLMIENHYKKNDFVTEMNIIRDSDILVDILHTDFEKGKFFKYISKAQYEELYDYARSEYSLRRMIKSNVKKIFKSMLS